MSDTESDSSEDLELELTAEELEEAQQRLLQKEPKKSSGDIVIDLDNKPKSKKYLPPEEFGINLIDDPIGNFSNTAPPEGFDNHCVGTDHLAVYMIFAKMAETSKAESTELRLIFFEIEFRSNP